MNSVLVIKHQTLRHSKVASIPFSSVIVLENLLSRFNLSLIFPPPGSFVGTIEFIMAYFLSLQYCDSGSTYQGNKYTLQLRTSPWTSVEQATLCLPKGGCQEHKALLANHVRGTPCRGRTVTTRCREKCRSYRGGSLT